MFWLALGLLLVATGFVGLFVPLLPTADFLILALPCFARSSPRLESWLLNHPRFGVVLRGWQSARAIPRHAKFAACLGMVTGFSLFLWFAHAPFWLATLVALILSGCAAWIVGRPVPTSTG
ncbi:YbaN family protein [Sphingomonas pituitosa]|uniref:YbaN family protein n=1 Tax=Sphingomonas pituitosa TaxID=99597 RepID=UPI000AFADC89|nr:YbaN family protein [Sphingomonas pituitosa]